MRAENTGRLFFRYSKEEKGVVEKLVEFNKDKEQEVIDDIFDYNMDVSVNLENGQNYVLVVGTPKI